MEQSAVVFDHVSKRFGDQLALDGLSFSVPDGRTIALLGPNGAGKSTAISLLVGLRQPTSGSIAVFGEDPRSARERGMVGTMLQEAGLAPAIKVQELITFYRGLYRDPLPMGKIVDTAGIGEFLDGRVEKLSGGQRRRVQFALAIAGNPRLLFLDEPTAALDVEARRHFWHAITAFAADGRTVLFTTHYLEEADAHAEQVLLISKGRLVAAGSPQELKRMAGLRTVRFHASADAQARVRTALPGADIRVAGDVVTIATADAEAVLADLYSAGIQVQGLEVSSGSLEDAIVQMEGADA